MRDVGERREKDGSAYITLKDKTSPTDGFDVEFPADQGDLVASCKQASKCASEGPGTEDADAHVPRCKMRGYL